MVYVNPLSPFVPEKKKSSQSGWLFSLFASGRIRTNLKAYVVVSLLCKVTKDENSKLLKRISLRQTGFLRDIQNHSHANRHRERFYLYILFCQALCGGSRKYYCAIILGKAYRYVGIYLCDLTVLQIKFYKFRL